MADTDYSQTIIGYYQNILGRTPDASEVAVWNSRLQSGDVTISGLANTFATSPEAQAYSQPVAELYQSLLGRSPDQAGLQHWTAQYKDAVPFKDAITHGPASHAALASIAQQFFQSPETQALYGSNGSTAADVTASAVTKLYENALGRPPGTLANGTSEVQYWVDKAQAQNLSLQNIATQFALSPEATSGKQQARVVANLIAGATGIELTPGADNLQGTSNNDLFVAGTYLDNTPNQDNTGKLASTLGNNDTLTGNGGNDTLLVRGLQKDADNNLGAPTLNNIQNLDIQGSTGSASLNLQNAQGTNNVSLASDSGLNLTLQNAQNVQNLGVDSSNNAQIDVREAASALNVALTNTNGTAQTVTLHDRDVKNLAVSVTGAEKLNLNTGKAQSINVTGQSGSLELNGAGTGAFASLTSVDASNFAGSSKINVNELINNYGATNLATVTAGSGSADEVIASGQNLASATNTTGVNVSGFEELGALGGKYDLKALNAAGNSISKVDVSHATGAVELDNAQSGLTVASTRMAAQPQGLTVKNVYATTGNALNLQVGDNATAKTGASIGDVTLDKGTSTVNIVSDLDKAGTAGVGTDGNAVYANTISGLDAANSGVSSIDVSGAGNLDVTNAGNIIGSTPSTVAATSAFTIDASKATGQVNFGTYDAKTETFSDKTGITGSGKGDTFIAGSGDTAVKYSDNLGDAKTTNTFTGGAGNDVFTITDKTNNVLTGGAGVDKFDVTGVTGTGTGTGTATFNYSSASDALISVDAKGTETGIETITGFKTGDSNTVKDKIDLSALGLNVSGGIGYIDDSSSSSSADVYQAIKSGHASATDLSSLKDLFTAAGTGTTTLPPADGGTSEPSGNFAATLVNLGGGNDLLFVNNAGSTGFDASQDSVISLSGVTATGTGTTANPQDWAQALILSK